MKHQIKEQTTNEIQEPLFVPSADLLEFEPEALGPPWRNQVYAARRWQGAVKRARSASEHEMGEHIKKNHLEPAAAPKVATSDTQSRMAAGMRAGETMSWDRRRWPAIVNLPDRRGVPRAPDRRMSAP